MMLPETTTCTGCTAAVGRQRATFGYTLCRTCHRKAAIKCTCEDCGCTTRVLRGQNPKLCFACERRRWFHGKLCARCNRAPKKRARTRRGDSALCGACCSMQTEPVQCEYCGEVGLKRSRNYQLGFTKLACPKCMRQHAGFVTCAGCRRSRAPGGEINGKPYCEMCFPTGAPPIIFCASCGKKKYQFNKTECEDCAWERSHKLLIRRLRVELDSFWARELFERYHSESKLKTMRGHWRKNLKRDIEFFRSLERVFPRRDDLNGVLIVRHLGNAFVKKYRRAMSFLAHEGLIVMDDDPDFQVERSLDLIRRMTDDETEWIHAVLQRFLNHLLNARRRIPDRKSHSRIPVAPSSLRCAVRSAHRLLTYARDAHGVTNMQELSQHILDQFIGLRNERLSISAFIRYVQRHEKSFQPLKLYKARVSGPPTHLIMTEHERNAFVHKFANECGPGVQHWALICLLNLLYGQLPHRLVQMTVDQVREVKDGYEIRFARVWLPLDPIAQPLLSRWLASRREKAAFDATDSSRYLFPGMRTGTHVNTTSHAYYRRKHGYDCKAGRVTAIARMIELGLKQQKVLVDCFGLSPINAYQYLRTLCVDTYEAAGFVYHHYSN